MNYAKNRRNVLVVCAVFGALAFGMGLSVSGAFRADVTTKRGLFGPLRFGFDGGLGEREKESGKPAAAPLPADPQPPVMMTSSGGFPLTTTSVPYNGPTAEERAVLHELRDTLKANYLRNIKILSPEERQMVPPVPDVRLPPRHLTPYEIQEMRNTINTLKGAQFPYPNKQLKADIESLKGTQ